MTLDHNLALSLVVDEIHKVLPNIDTLDNAIKKAMTDKKRNYDVGIDLEQTQVDSQITYGVVVYNPNRPFNSEQMQELMDHTGLKNSLNAIYEPTSYDAFPFLNRTLLQGLRFVR